MKNRRVTQELRKLAGEALREELQAADPGRLKKNAAGLLLRAVDTKKLIKLGAAAGGVGLAAAAAGNYLQGRLIQRAVARELKKQLAPLKKQLDELQQLNEELTKKLEAGKR